MFINKYKYHFLAIIGCIVAIYVQASEQQNVFILIIGIAFLMYGLFKISATIPNKKNKDDDASI